MTCRKEIEHAIDLRRNIVPILAEGFTFEHELKHLTGKLQELPHYNALTVPHEYFSEAMTKLREHLLRQPMRAKYALRQTMNCLSFNRGLRTQLKSLPKIPGHQARLT